MTYQTYRKTLIIIGFLYSPIILWDIFERYLPPSAGTSFFAIVAFLSFRIPSLFLLFFSIYASVLGVTGTRKLEAPAIFIVLGAILVIASFGPPILFGYFAPNVMKEKHEYVQPKEIEKQAVGELLKDRNNLIQSRRQLDIAVTNARNTAFMLVCILAISTIGFLIFLRHKLKKGAPRSGFK